MAPLMTDEVALLSELGVALHGATLPADIVEERLTAVARRLGLEGEFFTLQSFLAMEVRNIRWVGVPARNYDAMVTFVRQVLGLRVN